MGPCLPLPSCSPPFGSSSPSADPHRREAACSRLGWHLMEGGVPPHTWLPLPASAFLALESSAKKKEL